MPFQKGNQLSKIRKWKKHSEASKKKMREAAKKKDKSFYSDPERNKKIAESRMGNKHPLWKGDGVSKAQLHQWIKRRKKKPDFCEQCNKVKPTDLANISQEYKRDINDFRWLCKKCHMEEHREQLIVNLKKAIKKNGTGEGHPMWKGGVPKCLDCGVKTNSSSYRAKRCRPCYLKLEKRGKRGKYSNTV